MPLIRWGAVVTAAAWAHGPGAGAVSHLPRAVVDAAIALAAVYAALQPAAARRLQTPCAFLALDIGSLGFLAAATGGARSPVAVILAFLTDRVVARGGLPAGVAFGLAATAGLVGVSAATAMRGAWGLALAYAAFYAWFFTLVAFYVARRRPAESAPAAAAANRVCPARLTARELDVLRLMGAGLRDQEICGELCISIATLKSHKASIYRKLGVRNRVEAVLAGQSLGLIANLPHRRGAQA